MNELYCFGKQKNKFLQEKINKAYFNEIIEFNKQKNFLSYANASHKLYIHCAERSERILFYAKHSSIANFDDISKFACGMTLNQRKKLVNIIREREIKLSEFAKSNINPKTNPLHKYLPKPLPVKFKIEDFEKENIL